jgi:sphingolipid delta-4 desaturase
MPASRNDYLYVDTPNPHLGRMRRILATHPEIKDLFGPTPSTALYTLALVAIQLIIAILLSSAPWWVMLPVAYIAGATINHALYVILHECTHNLVFKRPVLNRILALIANFPQFFPSSMQFFKYHMLHHTNQSEYDFDADLAALKEAKWIGNSKLKKMSALFFFSLVQGMIRPSRLKEVRFWDVWFVINVISQLSFLIVFYYFTNGWALLYFLLSTIFALGLHPMGGRWIQEHYVVRENQETNSYYGPLNKLCFNMGYHNEHHDFMKVPWSRLPQVRASAPEFYNNLFYYESWVSCLKRFIFSKHVSFFDRYVRPNQKGV